MRIQFEFISITVLIGSVVFADGLDESKAVAKIELLGGKVTRDESLPGRPVIGVDFQGSKRLNDKYLHRLTEFRSLKSLNLTHCKQITGASLLEIGRLKSLTTLNLCDTEITDSGLKQISGIGNLTTLNLTATQITDAGMKEIGKIKSLTTLKLHGCGQTLGRFPRLHPLPRHPRWNH